MNKTQDKAKSVAAKPKSRLSAAILESAQDLESLGVMSKRTLRGYEKRCLDSTEPAQAKPAAKPAAKKARPTLHRFTPQDVVRIRAKFSASQGYFAMQLHVSPTTVQQWESGAKTPSPVAAKLLDVVDKHGLKILA